MTTSPQETMGSSLPADKRPLEACPSCSTELCEHLVCRVCSSCPICDAKNTAKAVPRAVREYRSVTHAMQVNSRLRKLEAAGIQSEDMPDAVKAMDELASDCCPCGNRKRPYQSFCSHCFKLLPTDVREGLYLHMRNGYLQFVRRAWELLSDRIHRSK